jgi:C-terminal processing protease CtpA/Prc
MSRAWLAALPLVAASLCVAAPETPLDPTQALADFDAVWKAVDRDYAYHEARHTAWKRARDAWRPRAKVATREELAAVMEGALDTLHDENVAVMDRSRGALRTVPEEADIWARWHGEAAVVESVRIFGDADVAGVKPGDTIVSVDGMPIDRAVRDALRGKPTNVAARDWALRRVLAGPRTGELRLGLSANGRRRLAVVERRDGPASPPPAVLARRVGDGRDIGYLRVRTALGDPRLIGDFDAALDALAETRGLILDLREVTGRATTHEAAVAMMGRFSAATATWQLREASNRLRTGDTVAPRGTTYNAPVVVLVDRWTAGEGEALAAGLQAVAKARLLGTPMAGLRGELTEFRAPHSGIAVRFPSQRALLPDGSARERLAPFLSVDLAQPQVGAGDPILYQALKLLEPSG